VIADLDGRATRIETPCGDGVMVWRAWGAGPPLILLHGAHGAWTHWIRNVGPLSATRRVLAPDMPGYGDSAMPEDPDDVESFAQALAAGISDLGLEVPLDVVGFSTGAVIGAHLAALSPELVRRLIMVDAGGLDTPMAPVQMTRLRGLEGEARRDAQRANLLAIMIHHPKNADDLAIEIQAASGPRARAQAHQFVLPDKLLPVLPRVRAQVDLIWGEHDYPHPDPALQLAVVRRLHPNAQLRVVADAGHWAMYEGADAFNGALLELLDQPLRKA
jgi:pimeloyl-ACP methyl ester carboxylesterase